MTSHSGFRAETSAAANINAAVDRRAEAEREQQERAAIRHQEIAAQSSPLSGPEDRIRLWERLHGLRLPQSATHRLLRVIATQTNLSIAQVREEQDRRAAAACRSDVAAPT